MAARVTKPTTRIERDTMGPMEVPSHALYGASTQRAVLNFPISGRTIPFEIIRAFVELKRACAEANADLGQVAKGKTRMIVAACRVLLDGLDGKGEESASWWHSQFPVDVFQTGSGTSTNMNVNEVISNLACLKAGKPLGAKDPIHPNDHVNQGQSSNDTFPTAMQIAGAASIKAKLIPAIKLLLKELRAKEKAWAKVVKTGRTHLQDATPIRVGQELSGFAAQMEYAIERAERALKCLASNLPIGGTAVGTGINTDIKFGREVSARLAKRYSIGFKEAKNHFEAQATRDCVVSASGELKTIAVSLSKIANDLRWLASGPRCGIGEFSLPETQPGSSIMPGKVNPVICESVIQVACEVVSNDLATTLGGFGGIGSIFQLNLAMPLVGYNLQESIDMLSAVSVTFAEKAIRGLELNEAIATGYVEQSLMMCTPLAPIIGYERAAKLAKEAFATGSTIRELALRDNVAPVDVIDKALNPMAMTKHGK
jgi:fumarate hydratase class II